MLELKSWHYDLPKELGLEYGGTPQSEPAVYLLHMVYHTAFILLMKQSVLKLQDQGKGVSALWSKELVLFSFKLCEIVLLMKTMVRCPQQKLPIRQ